METEELITEDMADKADFDFEMMKDMELENGA
jgi:hypothetical protein